MSVYFFSLFLLMLDVKQATLFASETVCNTMYVCMYNLHINNNNTKKKCCQPCKFYCPEYISKAELCVNYIYYRSPQVL